MINKQLVMLMRQLIHLLSVHLVGDAGGEYQTHPLLYCCHHPQKNHNN